MFMHSIKLENILSFGPNPQELELRPLNVLIGPNGSGKSNFIEVLGLLKAAPTDISAPIREGGGSDNWIWRGEQSRSTARVEIVLRQPLYNSDRPPLRYSLSFGPFLFGMPTNLREEIAEIEQDGQGGDSREWYLSRNGSSVTLTYRDEKGGRGQRQLAPADVEGDQSILSQLKDPAQYPELTFLGMDLSRIHPYREWAFGRNTAPRLPQKADLPNHTLAEDGHNLGMVLNRVRGDPKTKKKFLLALRQLYHGIDDFDVKIEAGSVQVFLQERDITIPATRLSDGTLRYLCLLAILCLPSPASVICLEEPELGLHPDVLPGLADLLRESSERNQLIVTTHSDILVDALTDTPESVVICEKESGQTMLKRLDKDKLSRWLEKYRLGELWTSGELGGNRW